MSPAQTKRGENVKSIFASPNSHSQLVTSPKVTAKGQPKRRRVSEGPGSWAVTPQLQRQHGEQTQAALGVGRPTPVVARVSVEPQKEAQKSFGKCAYPVSRVDSQNQIPAPLVPSPSLLGGKWRPPKESWRTGRKGPRVLSQGQFSDR